MLGLFFWCRLACRTQYASAENRCHSVFIGARDWAYGSWLTVTRKILSLCYVRFMEPIKRTYGEALLRSVISESKDLKVFPLYTPSTI
jgi:hypothetical protein